MQRAPVGAGYRALEEVDVGLLAGLEHAEVGVDGGVVGDHPAGTGPGAVLGAVPGRPAVAFGRAVVLDAAALVERGQVERATGAGRAGLVVVEATAAPAGGFESESRARATRGLLEVGPADGSAARGGVRTAAVHDSDGHAAHLLGSSTGLSARPAGARPRERATDYRAACGTPDSPCRERRTHRAETPDSPWWGCQTHRGGSTTVRALPRRSTCRPARRASAATAAASVGSARVAASSRASRPCAPC